jgi:hypothetical protein
MPPSLYRTIEATLAGLCVAGSGAVIGLAFVDPAGAAESAGIVADHGGLDWLFWTLIITNCAYIGRFLVNVAWVLSPWWQSHPRVKKLMAEIEFRDCEFTAADEDYANVTAEKQEDAPVTVAVDWHFDIMCLMTIANRQRPHLASLFPSLFGEGSR